GRRADSHRKRGYLERPNPNVFVPVAPVQFEWRGMYGNRPGNPADTTVRSRRRRRATARFGYRDEQERFYTRHLGCGSDRVHGYTDANDHDASEHYNSDDDLRHHDEHNHDKHDDDVYNDDS